MEKQSKCFILGALSGEGEEQVGQGREAKQQCGLGLAPVGGGGGRGRCTHGVSASLRQQAGLQTPLPCVIGPWPFR